MKTDEESGEAEEPPGEPPCRGHEESEKNDELEWARKHVPPEPPGPHEVFRKTELHDRPPGSSEYRPVTKILTRREREIEKLTLRLGAIDERLDKIEDRIDRSIARLNERIHAQETREVS